MHIDKSVLVIVIMSLVTIFLRAIPFIVFSGKKETPKFIGYLSEVLPAAVMAMLVVFCLKDTSFSSIAGFLPQLAAGLVVVFSYLWKKNTLLSIILGTAVYMLMV